MSNRSTLLLEHHLKELRLPTFLRKLAAQCAAEGAVPTTCSGWPWNSSTAAH